MFDWNYWLKTMTAHSVQTRSYVSSCAQSGRLNGDLSTDSSAQTHHTVVHDAVKNLHTVASFAQYTRFVKRIEMLRHIGLCGVDFPQQLSHVFFAMAEAADDLESHRRRHHTKYFGSALEHLICL